MPSQPVFRFAPSPNGYLHLGHAYSALFTWQAARDAGGTALLRIEDIDTARCRAEYDAAIREDLHWLGLAWPEPVMRQSERFPIYAEARSRIDDLLYPCSCTRGEIAARTPLTDPDGAPLYDGHCRHHPAEMTKPLNWRIRMDDALARTGGLHVREHPVSDTAVKLNETTTRVADPTPRGDVVIVRKDMPTSYHLSVVVDDAAQGVTTVTRGMDLYFSTDIHALLQALLGLPSPTYAHHGLVMDRLDKLSKSRGSTSLRALREAGWTPADVRRRLGFAG